MAIIRRVQKDQRAQLPAVGGGSVVPAPSQWGDIALPALGGAAVLGLPAANRAVQLVSNAVASMSPMELWGTDGLKSQDVPDVLRRPNITMGCFDFFQMATEMVVMRGNFLGIKADYDERGFPRQIVPVPAGVWTAYFDGDGYLVYSVQGRVYSRDQVVHVRANGAPNQPMGIGVVERFRRAIGQALDQQNYAADTYRSGSIPPGVINLDKPEISPEQADYVQGQWMENHQGSRAPAVLPSSMTFEAVTWTPEDLQFLEARTFTVAEIAHMFNLDPTDLGAALGGSASITYANIEQRQVQRITDTYGPWMRRFEEEWSDLVPDSAQAKMVPENLLRTDSKTRAEVDKSNIESGVTDADEARKRDGRPPLPKPDPPKPAVPGGDAPAVAVDDPAPNPSEPTPAE